MSDPFSPSPTTLAESPVQWAERQGEAFEAAWRAVEPGGVPPRIEDYLGPAPEPERTTLLVKLIALDVACRRRRGEAPRPDEYLARFPVLATD